ncbi:MAG TPA: hypothetical protein VIM11_12835, partial [Tepidisphaeraceae bacterium]
MGRAILIGLLCVGLVGCQASTSPDRVAQLDRHHAVSMMRAAWDGQYTLYLLPSDPKGKRTVVQTAYLKKNDPLGFRQRETGAVAVAGEMEVPLTSGEYEWVMQADKGQTDYLATTGLVLVIVAVVVGVLVIIIAANTHIHLQANPGAFSNG